MALAACLLGYGEVGLWLRREMAKPNTWVVVQGNPYAKWMDDYGGEGYQEAVKLGLGAFLLLASTTTRLERLMLAWECRHHRGTRRSGPAVPRALRGMEDRVVALCTAGKRLLGHGPASAVTPPIRAGVG